MTKPNTTNTRPISQRQRTPEPGYIRAEQLALLQSQANVNTVPQTDHPWATVIRTMHRPRRPSPLHKTWLNPQLHDTTPDSTPTPEKLGYPPPRVESAIDEPDDNGQDKPDDRGQDEPDDSEQNEPDDSEQKVVES